MTAPYSRSALAQGFRNLGVETGDTLFVHSSFKSLGPVGGGAGTVVGALEDAIGNDGLILMPSFHLVAVTDRVKTWDIERSPSSVGWITEFFRLMPDTYRSDHCSHSVAARGREAREVTSDHRLRKGLRSRWDRGHLGFAFGDGSPMWKAYQRGGKILMLGVDYQSSTYVHIAESLYRSRNLDKEGQQGRHPVTHLTKVGEFWESVGEIKRGKVGEATCRMFRIREYVDTVVKEFDRNIGAYVKDYLTPPDDVIGP